MLEEREHHILNAFQLGVCILDCECQKFLVLEARFEGIYLRLSVA